MEDKFLESIAYLLPALITAFVCLYMMKNFLHQQNAQQKIAVLADKKKETLPIKLQAFERMVLFCERINPVKIVTRIKPISNDAKDYAQLLISTIEQEFQHNLVQQIYISDECWMAILASKRAVINKFNQVAETSSSANDFRENVLIDYSNSLPPTETAISFIKKEVRKLL